MRTQCQFPVGRPQGFQTTGKAHNQRFVVRAVVQDSEAGGEGTSRRNTEQQAAERLLVRLKEREST